MPTKTRARDYVTVELPDREVTVDFLDRCGVNLKIEGDTLYIEVRAMHGRNAATWDNHDFKVPLRPVEPEDNDEDNDADADAPDGDE